MIKYINDMIPSPAELKGEKFPEKVRGSARAAGPPTMTSSCRGGPEAHFVRQGFAHRKTKSRHVADFKMLLLLDLRRSLRSVGIYAQ